MQKKIFDIKGLGKDIRLSNMIYFRNEKVLDIYIESQEIIKYSTLKEHEDKLKQTFKDIKNIRLRPRYKFENKKIEDFIGDFYENIKYIVSSICPSTLCTHDSISFSFEKEENKIIMDIKDKFVEQRIKGKNIPYSINKMLEEETGFSINIEVRCLNQGMDMDKYTTEKIAETEAILYNLGNKPPLDNKGETSDKKKTKAPEKKFIDKSFIKKENTETISISELKGDDYGVKVVGEIFAVEKRELRNGKFLIQFAITDYTGSIYCKIFSDDSSLSFGKGDYIKVSGDVIYDNYSKEIILKVKSMGEASRKVRQDLCKDKRVELHAHTTMSAMDAICSPSELIKKAKDMGHTSIAITDHGVVQGFPEAMEAGMKNKIKIIYGVEGYLANDISKIVKLDKDADFMDEFIVFDIETTGLSNTSDRITEIGAVKIRNMEIIDTFSALINPEMPIPLKIQELTGISNEMVREKPTIDKVLPEFLEYIGDKVLVAHNSEFDIGFIRENAKRLNLEFDNNEIDTLKLSRVILKELKKHKLNLIAKHLGINLENHHRAVDDAQATAQIFIKFMEILKEKSINNFNEINTKLGDVDFKALSTNHIVILAKNTTGLKNLYKLISKSHIDYFYKNPRILKSMLNDYREGLLLGSACERGELYQAILKGKTEKEIDEIALFYDYIEIMPLSNNKFMVDKGIVKSESDLIEINKKLIEVGRRNNIKVVATSDSHFVNPEDEIYRKIIQHSLGFKGVEESTPLYFKSTDEMLDEFSYLGAELAYEVVVKNTNDINDMIESLLPIPDGTFPPIIEGSETELREMCFKKAKSIYGENLPEIVEGRLERELNSIISNGYAVMYIIAQKLVTKSIEDGYLVGSRGSVGSSFAATMSDITEVNPLAPHYVCSSCKHSEFITDGSYASGADLPDKKCPKCDTELTKDGHDIPFEVFLGFEGDKEPDIDLNFAGEYQANAHKYTEELFGEGYVYKAGTIGTIAEKTAYGFAKKFVEETGLEVTSAEVERLKSGCTGIKRTSGQHPGGIMVVPKYKEVHDFTPIQYPANDSKSGVITTHFDYHSISGRILKLDILGHDVPTIIKMLEDITKTDATKIPLDDPETISIFTTTESLKCDLSAISCPVGSLGIPEFGTKFVRQMLIDTKPTTFGELVRISGLSHGTDVWINNAQELVRNNIAELKEVISTRDDIMNYLILMGLKPKTAFKIMENVRKGKGLTDEQVEDMKEKNVPAWYIDSCNKIKYMFPKAHAAAYVMMSFRIAYYKVHHKEAFYATYFTTKAEDFDVELICKGKEAVLEKLKEIESLGNEATAKEKNMSTVLEVAYEMFQRGVKLRNLDIYKSKAKKFTVVENELLPPLISMQGLGETVAISIERESSKEFMSIEDFRQRTKTTKTVIESLINHGCLSKLPETNQLSLL